MLLYSLLLPTRYRFLSRSTHMWFGAGRFRLGSCCVVCLVCWGKGGVSGRGCGCLCRAVVFVCTHTHNTHTQFSGLMETAHTDFLPGSLVTIIILDPIHLDWLAGLG